MEAVFIWAPVPRCGTGLLQRLVTSSRQVLVFGEDAFLVQVLPRSLLARHDARAETEQAAFHIGHIVPGIDFTNDPLLQGRLFSYTDTQLLRLGGPNFHEIPINRLLCPFQRGERTIRPVCIRCRQPARPVIVAEGRNEIVRSRRFGSEHRCRRREQNAGQ